MSDQLTITASVSRDSLGLADLNIDDGSAYELVTAGPGLRRWVRDLAVAPAVHGAAQVSARMDLQVAPVSVRVLASTKASLDTRSAALVAAFSQLRFNLTITIDGGTETWKCFAADGGPSADGSSSDGSWDKYGLLAAYRQVYAFQVPRQPVPVDGVM